MIAGSALSAVEKGGVVEVRLHRDPCNEIGRTALNELGHLVGALEAAAPRAVIWYSDRKRGFSAGADLLELREGLQAMSRLPRLVRNTLVKRRVGKFLARIHDTFDRLDQLPCTTICVTHGVVFGGGFELALTADVIVAEKGSRFAFPELRLGLVPGFGGIPRLERDVGNAVVRDVLLTGRSLGAQRAHALGLVSQLVPRGKGLDIARRLAEQVERFEPAVVARAKAFAKPLPVARLKEEQAAFLAMITDPAVSQALERFANHDGPRPYL